MGLLPGLMVSGLFLAWALEASSGRRPRVRTDLDRARRRRTPGACSVGWPLVALAALTAVVAVTVALPVPVPAARRALREPHQPLRLRDRGGGSK